MIFDEPNVTQNQLKSYHLNEHKIRKQENKPKLKEKKVDNLSNYPNIVYNVNHIMQVPKYLSRKKINDVCQF